MKPPIAYVYEGAVYCPDCAAKIEPSDPDGKVMPIWPWEEWYDPADPKGLYVLVCDTCLCEIDEVDLTADYQEDSMDAQPSLDTCLCGLHPYAAHGEICPECPAAADEWERRAKDLVMTGTDITPLLRRAEAVRRALAARVPYADRIR